MAANSAVSGGGDAVLAEKGELIEDFHFLRPWMLLLLLPVCALVIREWRRDTSFNSWQDVIDLPLLQFQLGKESVPQNRLFLVLMLLAAMLLSLALAGPVWEQKPVPVFRDQRARVIVLDASQSMEVGDVAPSRMTRARFKVRDLLERSRNIQVGLVAFGAAPYVISPLTDDTRTINAMVSSISPAIMPVQGSDLAAALNEAGSLMQGAGVTSGQIVLVGDAVPSADAFAAAATLRSQGYTLSIVGVGTEAGAPIPERGSFVKDINGNIVVAGLEVAQLRKLAESAGGRFAQLSSDDSDISAVLRSGRSVASNERRTVNDKHADQWVEYGPWLLLPLIPMVALMFRRGVL